MIFQKIAIKYKQLSPTFKVAFWFVFCSFFQKGISVLTSPIFNRILTTDEYGLFSVYSSWNSIFSIFATLNLAAGFVSVGLSNTDDKQQRNELISAIQGLSTIVSGVAFSLFLIFHNFFEKITSLPFSVLIFMFASYIFVNSFSLAITKDKFNKKYVRMVIVTIVFGLLSPIVTVLFILLCSNNRGILRIIVPIVVAFSYNLFFFIRNFLRGKKFFNYRIWKNALLFNLPLIPHYLANIVLASSDRIVINSIYGLSEAGIYGLAYSISSLLIILIDPLYTSIQPWFYKSIDNGNHKDIKTITLIITVVLTIITILSMLLGPELVFLFGSNKYDAAIILLPTLFCGIYLSSFYTQFIQIEFKKKRTLPIMISSVVAACLNVGLNLWLVPIFGFEAAAFTTLFCYVLYTIFHYLSQRIIVKSAIFCWPVYLLLFLITFTVALCCRLFLYNLIIVRLVFVAIISIGLLVLIFIAIKNKQSILERLRGKDRLPTSVDEKEKEKSSAASCHEQ